MKILTTNNISYNLNKVPELVDDLQYCVLDTTNKKNIDFFFIPLIFLESFNAPSMVLEVGEYTVQMPIDWSVMIIEKDLGVCEMVPLTSLNDRGFEVLTSNPLAEYMIKSAEPKVVNVFQDVKWYLPKLKHGHILAVPVNDGPKPPCVYFEKDINQIPDELLIGDFF